VATKVHTFIICINKNQVKDFFSTEIAEVVTVILFRYEFAIHFS